MLLSLLCHCLVRFLISALWILSQRQSRVADADLARRQDFRVPASPALQGFQELLATLFRLEEGQRAEVPTRLDGLSDLHQGCTEKVILPNHESPVRKAGDQQVDAKVAVRQRPALRLEVLPGSGCSRHRAPPATAAQRTEVISNSRDLKAERHAERATRV